MKFAALLLFLVPTLVAAQDPPKPPPFVARVVLSAPETLPANSDVLIVFSDGSQSRKPLKWKAKSPRDLVFEVVTLPTGATAALVRKPQNGLRYKFDATALGDVDAAGFPDSDNDSIEIQVDKSVTPTPPKPDDTVIVPPKPDVVPDDGPIGNLRVLILRETSAKDTLEQWITMFSTAGLQPYLKENCLKDTNGKPEFRIWDPNIDVSGTVPEWQETFKIATSDVKPLPKVCVFAGNKLMDTFTITTAADTLAFVKKKVGK